MGQSVGLSIERSWVRFPLKPLQNLGNFFYTLTVSLGLLLVGLYPKKDGSISRASDFPFQKKQFSV